MIIHSNKITLRSFTSEDVNDFYEMVHNDSTIEKYVPYAYVHNKKEAEENIEVYKKGDCINDFYLVIEIDGVTVGAILAIRMFPRTLDVSLIISKLHRGKGIMHESLKIFVNWLKNNTSYKILMFVVKKENASSIRLVEKFNVNLTREQKDSRTYTLHI